VFKIALTLEDLAVREGSGWNCKFDKCEYYTYYTVRGMTETKGLRDMLEHWEEKHEFELSVIMAAKEHGRQKAKNE